MKLKWFGHSCFLLTAESGTKVMMDPCGAKAGYAIEKQQADAVSASHGHWDHNEFSLAGDDAVRVTETGETKVKDVRFFGIHTCHDPEQGALRGENVMFTVEMDGLRILHCGDLGHMIDDATAAACGRVDILLAPVGGTYTIDADGAHALMEKLDPTVFIPMHYKLPQGTVNVATVDGFLSLVKDRPIAYAKADTAAFSADDLGEKRVLVMEV